jgi:hypothetical protein
MAQVAWADRGLRLVDLVLPVAGALLLGIGLTAAPSSAVGWTTFSLGWAVLAASFFAGVAEADGLAIPRLGRVPIVARGCGELPFDFTVKHRGATFLFSRDEQPDGWSESYTVREAPAFAGADARWEVPRGRAHAWTPRGRAEAADLRIERHGRVSYVTRRSLGRALERAQARSGLTG